SGAAADSIAGVLQALDSGHPSFLPEYGKLSPFHLAAFYRYAKVAQKLGTDVETLVQLLKLAEIEVLDSLHACERMVDHWDWWELAGLDAREALLAVIPDWSGEAETAALVEELARTISPE